MRLRRAMGVVMLVLAGLELAAVRAQMPQMPAPPAVRPTAIIRGRGADAAAILEITPPVGTAGGIVHVVSADGKMRVSVPLKSDAVHQAGTAWQVPVPLSMFGDAVVGARVWFRVMIGESGVAVVPADKVSDEPAGTIWWERPDPAWVVHLIAGFHFDPVWWNTQAHYVETGAHLDGHTAPGLTLVDEYLKACEAEPTFFVALHQLPYLKTFVEARPERAAALRRAIDSGQICLVGGTYNEMQSTLISSEAAVRNAVHGALFQRMVLNGSGVTAWQCDVFGHDPSFPSVMAGTGHTNAAFARGPFHQWGAPRDKVNFPSEFMWMAPDGRQVLTHYMTGHYGYGYPPFASGANHASEKPADIRRAITDIFEDLRQPAATHHVMVPMHQDFIRPLDNLGAIVRTWNAEFSSPLVVVSTPDVFFDAVRSEVEERGITLPVITRDMNPIYTGCPVSFADLKQAERACEVTLRDAEMLATEAWLAGAGYPKQGLDACWRQLMFNAHHDAVTGSMSDQVYLDIMAGYRQTLDSANALRARALAFFNRGRRPWRPPEVPESAPATSVAGPVNNVIENTLLRVVVDADHGGAITSIFDKAAQKELLWAPGNVLVLHDELSALPGQGEGPWHLAPTGVNTREQARTPATLTRPRGADPVIEIAGEMNGFRYRQRLELAADQPLINCETTIESWNGRDQLLRIEFPFDLPGTRPLHQTAAAVIARSFSRDVDVRKDPWTLDQATGLWAGLGVTASVDVMRDGVCVRRDALGVGEIVVPAVADAELLNKANELAAALVLNGVTTTIRRANQRLMGDLALDSHGNDFRVVVGGTALRWDVAYGRMSELNVPVLSAPFVIEGLLTGHRIAVPSSASSAPEHTPPPERGVAVFNDGLASTHINSAGRFSMNVLRACTGWPSGTWIDGNPRRQPDGAPFGTMHGAHTWRYAVMPFSGSWRSAGVPAAARAWEDREFAGRPEATPLGALVKGFASTTVHAPTVAIDEPGIELRALKAAGFGEAVWATHEDDAGDAHVVARLWNGTGAATVAHVRVRRDVHGAFITDLTEQPQTVLEVVNNAVAVPMDANATATVLFVVAHARPPGTDRAPSLDLLKIGPTPSAYWLENRGEDSPRNGMVAIVPDQRSVKLVNGEVVVPIRIANNCRDDMAVLDLGIEAAKDLNATIEPAHIDVPPGGFAVCQLSVKRVGVSPGGAALPEHGRSLITIHGVGVPVALVDAAVWVTDRTTPLVADDVTVDATPLAWPGSDSAPRALLTNQTEGPITGELRWIAPFALWPFIESASAVVSLVPHGEARVELKLRPGFPAGFVVPRFTFGGEVTYGPPVAITTAANPAVLAFAGDRVRLRRGQETKIDLRELLAPGADWDSDITLSGPPGVQIRELTRHTQLRTPHEGRADDSQRIDFGVTAPEGLVRGDLVATGPGLPRAVASFVVAPEQRADVQLNAPSGATKFDGDLAEWRPNEFTEATGPLGKVRCAVRYGAAGLAFAFDVTDEKHVQTKTGASIWEGDSVQIALSASPNTMHGYNTKDLEFGFALTADGPLTWCWYGGNGGSTGAVAGAQTAIRHADGHTYYEVLLPASALPGIPIGPGATLGFSYIANHDNGTGYLGATQWTGGMVGGKDSSLFGELQIGFNRELKPPK